MVDKTFLYCAWATANSFGFVAPDAPVETEAYNDLKMTMQGMRADIQTTKR